MIETICLQCLGETIGYRQQNDHVKPVCTNDCFLSQEEKSDLAFSFELETVRPMTHRLITNIMLDLPLQTMFSSCPHRGIGARYPLKACKNRIYYHE
jgi:hypothetical protein